MLKLAPPPSSRQVPNKAKSIRVSILKALTFIKPHFIEELGEEGLYASEIAASLGIKTFHVNERVQRSFEKACKDIQQWSIIAVAMENSGIRSKKGYSSFAFNTRAAKAFVATYNNKIGRSYLNFLFDCEAFAMARLKELEAANTKRILAAAKRKPRVLSAAAAGCKTPEEYKEYLETCCTGESVKALVLRKIKFQNDAAAGIDYNNDICLGVLDLF